MFFGILINVFAVIFLCGVVIMIELFINKKYKNYVLGVVFGIITIFLIYEKIVIINGSYFDFRFVSMTMAGFIGGPVTALIAALISSVYRYSQGGISIISGITTIIIFGIFGCILKRNSIKKHKFEGFFYWFGIGILMITICYLIFLITPPWVAERLQALKMVSLPFFVITPFAVTVLFNMFFWTEKLLNDFLISKIIINKSYFKLLIFDSKGIIIKKRNIDIDFGFEKYLNNPLLLLDSDKTKWFIEPKQKQREITLDNGKIVLLDFSNFKMPNGEYLCVVILNDITEFKKIQEEVSRLDRLNLVGQMAAGIGHEIRNPMTTVRGYLQLLGSKPEYHLQKQTFDLMISELDRANWIITEFLSLAKIKPTERIAQNLNDILKKIYPLIEADTFNQNKKIRFNPGKISDLLLNSKEIIQMILNLTRNGLDAMEENSCLTIKTFMETDKVVLLIEDEGCGMTPEIISKLGTPFFTTKGNGTGLGLAICYRIAEANNASITVDSSSKGSRFYVIFSSPPLRYNLEKLPDGRVN